MLVRVVLVDVNKKMIDAWQSVFEENPEVQIVQGSILDQAVSAWVSPTNSHGRMRGGLDAIRLFKDANPATGILVYTVHPEDQFGLELLSLFSELIELIGYAPQISREYFHALRASVELGANAVELVFHINDRSWDHG